jgi:hypothetical protein
LKEKLFANLNLWRQFLEFPWGKKTKTMMNCTGFRMAALKTSADALPEGNELFPGIQIRHPPHSRSLGS